MTKPNSVIKLVENALDEEYLRHINDSIYKLNYQIHKSTPDSYSNFFASFPNENENDLFNYRNLAECLFKKLGIENDIEYVERGYTNCYPYNISGSWHQDTLDGQTVLFYPQTWKKEWEGSTLFKEEDSVDYVKNRVVLFNGNKLHMSDTHKNYGMRFTIAFKIKVNDA
tara:strand:+ start:64 stop:570 length:507 start_codon:yes stop_codon:yes gene_type:complete